MADVNPINVLLEAERDAEEEIAACQIAARDMVNSHLEKARAIIERSRRRVAKVHDLCRDRIERESAVLWQEGGGGGDMPEIDLDTLDAVAETLAARLTGGADD